MICKRLLQLLVCLLLGQSAAAQTFPVLRMQRFYGGPLDDTPCRLLKTADGDLILAGTLDHATNGRQGALLRLTPKGDTVWAQTLGGKGHDLLLDAAINPSSGDIFFCGGTGSDLKHQELSDAYYASDYWAGRVNAKGVLQWQRLYGGLLTDRAYGVAPTEDGCLIVGGSWSADKPVTCPKLRTTDAWTARLDAAGQLKTADCWGGDQPDWGQCVMPHPDGGYLVAGFTASPELDSSRSRTYGDAWIRRLDASGAEMWRQIIKEPYEDIIRRVIVSRYGLIHAVGSAGTANKDRQFWWLALSADGRVLHNVKFGGAGFDELTAVSECANGDFIVAGRSFSTVQGDARYFKGQTDFWLMRLTAQGNVVWRQTYGGPDDEAAVDVLEYAPGILYALGAKRNDVFGYGERGMDFWLLKVEELPCKDMNVSFTTNITRTEALKKGGTVRFVNKSAHGDEWLWYFGDGETSSERSPTKRYNKPGAYFPKLEVRAGEGCRKVFVAPNPFVVVE